MNQTILIEIQNLDLSGGKHGAEATLVRGMDTETGMGTETGTLKPQCSKIEEAVILILNTLLEKNLCVKGKEKALADALLIVPKTHAENSRLETQDMIISLISDHIDTLAYKTIKPHDIKQTSVSFRCTIRRTRGGVLNAAFMLKKWRDVFISLGGTDMNSVVGVEGSIIKIIDAHLME
ncbi:hypothetical protein Tco_0127728 [Tanacetum coccineum]